MKICIPCTNKKFGTVWSHVDVFGVCDVCGKKAWCFTRDEEIVEQEAVPVEAEDRPHESGATVYNFRDYVKSRMSRNPKL